MTLVKLDHVNVRTTQLETLIDWYTEVLGMHTGDRPNFPFPGAWMYVAGVPTVHLVSIEGPAPAGSEVGLKLEHFAFSATNRMAFEERLQLMGERFQVTEIESVNLVQINLWDPDGNHIHIDFPAHEDP